MQNPETGRAAAPHWPTRTCFSQVIYDSLAALGSRVML